MNRTGIGYAGWSWNPVVGCSPASAGCKNCFAKQLAPRLGYVWGHCTFKPERLDEPKYLKAPAIIFVCSMSDYFHPTFLPEWRVAIEKTIAACPQHTFIILTKRPEYALFWRCPHNVWFGTTTENQEMADLRWPYVATHKEAGKRFVSVEPMLGPVTFEHFRDQPDLVICGPETGRKARPFRVTWLTSLKAKAKTFFDQRVQHRRREACKRKG